MSWTPVANPTGGYSPVVLGESIWDDGATEWDVGGNIPTSFWDATSANGWSPVPSSSGSWVIVDG